MSVMIKIKCQIKIEGNTNNEPSASLTDVNISEPKKAPGPIAKKNQINKSPHEQWKSKLDF